MIYIRFFLGWEGGDFVGVAWWDDGVVELRYSENISGGGGISIGD